MIIKMKMFISEHQIYYKCMSLKEVALLAYKSDWKKNGYNISFLIKKLYKISVSFRNQTEQSVFFVSGDYKSFLLKDPGLPYSPQPIILIFSVKIVLLPLLPAVSYISPLLSLIQPAHYPQLSLKLHVYSHTLVLLLRQKLRGGIWWLSEEQLPRNKAVRSYVTPLSHRGLLYLHCDTQQ